MASKRVILNYGPKGVTADPDPVEVTVGDTIVFHKGPTTQANAKVRVTIKEPAFFSSEVFNEGDHAVHVTRDLPHEVPYECDLIVEGKALPRAKGRPGAGIKPR